MLPWQREFFSTRLLFCNSHYWGNVTDEYRRHILRNQQTTGLNAKLCVAINYRGTQLWNSLPLDANLAILYIFNNEILYINQHFQAR